MRPHAFVLFSGGLDSTTCLYLALRSFSERDVTCIVVNYRQRHSKEIRYALDTCKRLGIRADVRAMDVPKSLLTDSSAPIPDKSYAEIEGLSPAFVPFRNGLMLSAAAAIAYEHYGETRNEDVARFAEQHSDRYEPAAEYSIYFGAHAEDASNWAYPDCSPEFTGAMANAIYVGTYNRVRLLTPLQWLDKTGVVRLGHSMGVPFHYTWSCYAGGDKHCGVCPTCRARKQAFVIAGVDDPTEYAA